MKTIYKKTLFFFVLFFLSTVSIQAQNYAIDENFANGIPADWTTTSVSKTSNNSKTCVSMSSNAALTTPAIDKPTSLSFSHRASGNGKTLTVEKSIDGGAWVVVGTASPSSGSGWGSAALQVGEPGSKNVKVRFSCTSGTIYITDIKIEASQIGDAPTQQAGISIGTITGSSVVAQLTKGNGDGRLLVYKKGSAVDFVPQAGRGYVAGESSNGNIIAQVGDFTSATIQGLEAGETYHFAVFEYNGSEESSNYLLTAATTSARTLEVSSLILSTYKIAFDQLKVGNEDKREFMISGKYLAPASGNITVSVNGSADFAVSTDNVTYTSSVTIPYSTSTLTDAKVYIRFSPTELKDYSVNINVVGGGSDTQILEVTGLGSDTDTRIYYLSPSGKDTYAGSYDAPWYSLKHAVSQVSPGDIIYVRGGRYSYPNFNETDIIRIKAEHSGEAGKWIRVWAYNNEEPIFDFTTSNVSNEEDGRRRGIVHQGDYWYFYGIHFTKALDNGVKLEGSNNIYERCTFSYCGDTGIQLGFGHNFTDSHPGISKNDGTYCSNNYIIDCDSYRNYDYQTKGGNADGFACKMHNGKDNWFIRCRAWENSDDAWDLYETDYSVYIIDCWGWASAPRGGILAGEQGNGNGIKLGGNGSGGSSKGKHEVWNCVAFNNNKTGSVKGFDQNSHKDGVKIVNSLAFNNGYDFMFETASDMDFYNNVCMGKQEIANGNESNNALGAANSKGWATAMTGVSVADYEDLSETAAMAPRGTDGSLPTGFARLKKGSKLIGAAKNGLIAPLPTIGIELVGSALEARRANTDIGPFDYNTGTSIPQLIINPEAELNLGVYPNPVNDYANIKFAVNENADVAVSIYAIQGCKVMDLGTQAALAGVDYYLPINNVSQLSPGIYVIQLTTSTGDVMKTKMIKW